MQALVLGSAAGGGFPQWNCGCPLCMLARSGDPRAKPRTQVSIAVSADGENWLLVGASPDLRQQILDNPHLAPRSQRHSPIAAVAIVSADVDGMAGLLVLREQQPFTLYAPRSTQQIIEDNPLFRALDPALVPRVTVEAGQSIQTGIGLTLTLLGMPGKIPLYYENRAAADAEAAITYAAKLQGNGRTIIIAPACAAVTDEVLAALAPADLLFFDGTLFDDEEMIRTGLSHKTGRRMGHVSLDGPEGSLARLYGLAARKIFFHINNSNPILIEDSAERARVQGAGFEVAHDGMLVEV